MEHSLVVLHIRHGDADRDEHGGRMQACAGVYRQRGSRSSALPSTAICAGVMFEQKPSRP
jgi:hypothetical protein